MHIIYLAGACRLTTRRKLRMHFSSFVTEMSHQILIGDASKNCLFLDNLYIFPTALFLTRIERNSICAGPPVLQRKYIWKRISIPLCREKKIHRNALLRSCAKLCLKRGYRHTHSSDWLWLVIPRCCDTWSWFSNFTFVEQVPSRVYSNILL